MRVYLKYYYSRLHIDSHNTIMPPYNNWVWEFSRKIVQAFFTSGSNDRFRNPMICERTSGPRRCLKVLVSFDCGIGLYHSTQIPLQCVRRYEKNADMSSFYFMIILWTTYIIKKKYIMPKWHAHIFTVRLNSIFFPKRYFSHIFSTTTI